MIDSGVSAGGTATEGVSLGLIGKVDLHSCNHDLGVDVRSVAGISVNEEAINKSLLAIGALLEHAEVFKAFLEIGACLSKLVATG